jgi:hypothetical protein
MRKFSLEVSEQNFNLIWRALHALEQNLLQVIAENEDDIDGEFAAFAGNDLVYLRLYRNDLERAAKDALFSKNVFSLSDEVLEP